MLNNNYILRRLRYTFDYNDLQMASLFGQADCVVTEEQIKDWLRKEDDPEMKEISEEEFATFLNGLINKKRGKREGAQPVAEKTLNNNIILRKIKIALNLRGEDIQSILKVADLRVSKHEISAFFRNPSQNQYRPCQDQILRNFLQGLQMKFRPK